MKKEEVIQNGQAAVELALRRMGAENVGSSIKSELGSRTKGDPQGAIYAVNDSLWVPNDDKNLFKNTFGSNPSFGVVCPAESAGVATSKNLFFSALDRGVPEYGPNLQPTGKVVYAKTDKHHDVFDAVSKCANEEEVYDLIKGKNLIVAALNPVTTARYNRDGQIIGTRKRNVPVFTFGA